MKILIGMINKLALSVLTFMFEFKGLSGVVVGQRI
jgi:hypothetical protein